MMIDNSGPTMPVQPATPMEMLNRALMSGAAPETLERMLALQERWEKTEARKAFDRAMALAKAELPVIRKNRVVSFGAGKAAYQHEDLAEIASTITPILSRFGLSYRFRTNVTDKLILVTCILSHEGGHAEENSLPGPADTSGSKNPIQAIGSTVTYLQRYTLKAALGLAASADTDANDVDEPAKLTGDQVVELSAALEQAGRSNAWFCQYAHIELLEDLPPEKFARALTFIKDRPVRGTDNAAGQ